MVSKGNQREAPWDYPAARAVTQEVACTFSLRLPRVHNVALCNRKSDRVSPPVGESSGCFPSFLFIRTGNKGLF